MFAHADKVYREIRALNIMDSSVASNQAAVEVITDFYRALGLDIVTKVYETFLKHQKVAPIHQELIGNLYLGIFCEAYRCGDCSDQTSLAIFKLLESQFSGTIEHIFVEGHDLMKGRENDVLDHHSVLLNRKETDSPLNNRATWKNVILLDTWAKGLLKEYKGSDTPTEYDLTRGDFKVEGILSRVNVIRPWTPVQWEFAAKLLTESLKVLVNDFEVVLKASGRQLTPTQSQAELEMLKKVFTEKIKKYSELAKLKHATNPHASFTAAGKLPESAAGAPVASVAPAAMGSASTSDAPTKK